MHVPGGAEGQVDAEHPLRDVSQGQVGNPAHVRVDAPAPDRRGHLVQDAVVGEQDALGVAGGPGRIQEGDRVLRSDGGQPRGHQFRLGGQSLPAQRREVVPGQVLLPRRACARVADDDRAQGGQLRQHRLPPGQLVRPVEHGDPGRAVPGHEGHLLGGQGGVESDRDPAGVHGAVVGQHVLGPVRHHDRDVPTGGQAERDEARRQLQRLLPGLGPGQGGPAGRIAGRAVRARLGQGRVITEPLRSFPELITHGLAPDRFLDLRPLPENLRCHRSPPPGGPGGPGFPGMPPRPRAGRNMTPE